MACTAWHLAAGFFVIQGLWVAITNAAPFGTAFSAGYDVKTRASDMNDGTSRGLYIITDTFDMPKTGLKFTHVEAYVLNSPTGTPPQVRFHLVKVDTAGSYDLVSSTDWFTCDTAGPIVALPTSAYSVPIGADFRLGLEFKNGNPIAYDELYGCYDVQDLAAVPLGEDVVPGATYPSLGHSPGCRMYSVKAHFNSEDCDVVEVANTTAPTSISTPNYPDKYPNSQKKCWLVYTSSGYVNLLVKDSHLEYHHWCRYDWMMITKMDGEILPNQYRWCGSGLPDYVSVPGGVMVWFRSDSYRRKKGATMLATHSEQESDCERVRGNYRYNEMIFDFSTPTKVCWVLTTDNPEHYSHVALQGQDLDYDDSQLPTMRGQGAILCDTNAIRVYDGPSASSPLLATMCDNTTAQDALSSSPGGVLYVEFESTAASRFMWFELTFTASVSDCTDLTASTTRQELTTPNHPDRYPKNQLKCWRIASPSATQEVHLVVLSSNLEPGASCDWDFIEVKDGRMLRSPRLMRWCGPYLPSAPFNSTDGYLYVRFQSDASRNYRGVKMEYYIPGSSCDEILATYYPNVLLSVGYPNGLTEYADYCYTFSTKIGYVILLDLVDNLFTCPDGVTIYDGSSNTNTSMGKYCEGGTATTTQQTSGNAAHVALTYAGTGNNGFVLHYSYIPTGVVPVALTATEVPQSASYPTSGNYPDNIQSAFTVSGPRSSAVRVRFTSIDIDPSDGCNFDWLEIRLGATVEAPLVGKYCGDSLLLHEVISNTGGAIYIGFHSDNENAYTGFSFDYNTTEETDGPLLKFHATETQRQVHSPNRYGGFYPPNLVVTYVFEAEEDPPGNMPNLLRLRIEPMNINQSDPCVDAITLADGPHDDFTPQEELCGFQEEVEHLSSRHEVYALFVSDEKYNHGEFVFYFQSENSDSCVTLTATGERQTFSSEGFPSTNYTANTTSCWVIMPEASDERVVLRRLEFDLELPSPTTGVGYICQYDYVRVRNGSTDTAPFLLGSDDAMPQDGTEQRWCGHLIPSLFMGSPGHPIHVSFKSDGSNGSLGFQFGYELDKMSAECHTLISSLNPAKLNSPGYPGNYSDNLDECWVIHAQEGSLIVEVGHLHLDTSTSDFCDGDVVTVYEGTSIDGRLLSEWCDQVTPGEGAVSTSRSLLIRFQTDESGSGPGFSLIYRTEPEYSDWHNHGVLNALTIAQTISSPNYPRNYDRDTTTNWLISTLSAMKIVLEVIEMDIEGVPQAVCYDYLEVHDGPSPSSPILGAFCGTDPPGRVESSGDEMYIRFRTDQSVQRKGFQLNYWSEPVAAAEEDHVTLEATETTQVLQSAFFPNPYPRNLNMSWLIEGTSPVSLRALMFSLESHPDCAWDYLQIRDGATADSPLLDTWCGNMSWTHDVRSTNADRSLYVTLHTDGSTQMPGFSLTYVLLPNECQFLSTSSTSSFQTSSYPAPYERNSNQCWVLEAELNQVVQVSFSDFDLEHTSGCTSDYVEAFSGNSAQGVLISPDKRCGSELPASIISTGRLMYVHFRSDGSIHRKGFLANIFSVTQGSFCERLTASIVPGTITSPNYAQDYPGDQDLCWIISRPNKNERIRVVFDDFTLQTSSNCEMDYLEIRDGNMVTSPVLSKNCSNQLPEPITASGDALYIRFHSDHTGQARGFQLRYYLQTQGLMCTRLTASTTATTLTSPEDPYTIGFYPPNSDFCWVLEATNASDILQVTFTQFGLQGATTCTDSDYLQIREGSLPDSALRATLCGTDNPGTVYIRTHQAYIRFHTDHHLQNIGFTLEYQISEVTEEAETCVRIDDSASTKYIHSSNYPAFYEPNTDECWIITAGSNNEHVVLEIMNLHLEPCSAQMFDTLTIRDGSTSDSDRLALWCGPVDTGVVTSTGRDLYVHFVTDNFLQKSGFNFTYYFVSDDCGRLIASDISQQLTSPGYPSTATAFPNHCWIIHTAEPDCLVQVRLLTWDLPGGCTGSSVTLRNGDRNTSSVLETLCDTPNIESVFSTGHTMHAHFKSSMEEQVQGFILEYSQVDDIEDCHYHSVYTYPQSLQSPNYPNNYDPNSAECWILEAQDKDAVIRLEFDTVALDSNCNDHLKIYDGRMAEDAYEDRDICSGSPLPSQFTSSSYVVRLSFTSDGTGQADGFVINYNAVVTWATTTPATGDGSVGSGGTTPGDWECEELVVTTSIQNLESPGFPSYYNPGQWKCWVLDAGDGDDQRIVLDSTQFDLEWTFICDWGTYLWVVDGPNANGNTLGHFCGSAGPHRLTSTGRYLYLEFLTTVNGMIFNTGFQLTYTIDSSDDVPPVYSDNCETLHAESYKQTLYSPGYPRFYAGNLDVCWRIYGSPAVEVSLETLMLENNCNCCDKLEIYDGATEGELLKTYCGVEYSDMTIAHSGVARLAFISDSSMSGSGFRITYKISDGTGGGTGDVTGDGTGGGTSGGSGGGTGGGTGGGHGGGTGGGTSGGNRGGHGGGYGGTNWSSWSNWNAWPSVEEASTVSTTLIAIIVGSIVGVIILIIVLVIIAFKVGRKKRVIQPTVTVVQEAQATPYPGAPPPATLAAPPTEGDLYG